MPKFTNHFVVEFSVLRGVGLWYNEINDGRMSIAVSLLLKVPHVSASAAEDTILPIFYTMCV